LQAVADSLADRSVVIEGPQTNRKLLQGCVSESLGMGAAKDERHKYQDLMVGYIASVLQADEQKHQAVVATAQGELDAANAALATSKSALEAAQGNLKAKQDDIKAKKATLSENQRGTHDAENHLETAKDEVENFDGIQAKKANERDQCYAALHSSLDAIKKGVFAKKSEKPKHISVIMKALKVTGADAALMACSGTALELEQDVRGSFDAMVVETVEKRLTNHVETLNKGLSDGPGLKAQKEAAASAAQSALEAAAAKELASSEAVNAAESERGPLEQAVKAAQQDVKVSTKGVEKKTDALKEEQRQLTHSTETLASFSFLSERPAVAPEPEPVAEDPVAEPAAEEPAAEDAA
jgi:hypothetical protein